MMSAERKLRDRRWIGRIREGDHAAFETLFHAYAEQLCVFAEQYVGAPEMAERLVQEVFLSVWRRRRSITLQGSIKSYLYTAARHQALDHLKHQRVVEQWAEHVASRDEATPQRMSG